MIRVNETRPAESLAVDRSLAERIRIALSAFALWVIIRLLCATLRIRVEGGDRVKAAYREGQGALLVSWHGSTMVPVYWLRRLRPYGIISVSRDGQIEALAFRMLGWRTIRGSSARGATAALRRAIRCLKRGNLLALTPDGPRGPAREIKPGSLYMAKSAGCPIFPVGVASSRRRLVGSWDSYMIPMPWARVQIVFGEPMYVGRDDDDRTVEAELTQRIDLAHEVARERLGAA
jgi:lysophospholipid acyltransferase (LPLAT)-like uncharacterized protein